MGQPAAKQGDQVIATDIHIVMIPSPGGPIPTPLPNPFAGQLDGALSSDVELRTIGLARGAERSLAALSPQTRAGLQAYADGVNAWVQRNPLPIQYAALELTQFRPWTALDCAIIGSL